MRSPVVLIGLGAVVAMGGLELMSARGDRDPFVPESRHVAQVRLDPMSRPSGAMSPRRERVSGDVVGEPFGAPVPKVREVEATSPPPIPAAPFPYRYAGQLSMEGGERQIYLLKGSDLRLVKPGDLLDGNFKVTTVEDDALEVFHVPSSSKTRLLYAALNADLSHGASEGGAAAPAVSPGERTPPVSTGSSTGPMPERSAQPGISVPNVSNPIVAGAAGSGGIFSAAAPAPAAATGGAAHSIAAGAVPTGQLGSAPERAGTMPLGTAPPSGGSMPVLPAPVGVMRTLPAPTGRLGI